MGERERGRVCEFFFMFLFRDGHFTFGTNTLNIPTHVLKVLYIHIVYTCVHYSYIHNILAIGRVFVHCVSPRKWIGNAVQNISSSTVRSRDKIARVRRARASYGYSSVLSPEVDYSSPQRYSSPPHAAGSRCSVSPLEV